MTPGRKGKILHVYILNNPVRLFNYSLSSHVYPKELKFIIFQLYKKLVFKTTGIMTGDVIKNGSLSISQCAICQIKADKKCTGCNEVAYCGRECQKKHWATHRKQCKCWKIMEDSNGVKGR